MIKAVFLGLITAAMGLLLFYGCGALIAWEINPGHWAGDLRGVIAIIGLVVSCIAGGIVTDVASQGIPRG